VGALLKLNEMESLLKMGTFNKRVLFNKRESKAFDEWKRAGQLRKCLRCFFIKFLTDPVSR
jgi:hypothetical protein